MIRERAGNIHGVVKYFFKRIRETLDIEVYGKVYPSRRIHFDEAGVSEKGLMCNKGETLTSVKKKERNANNSLTTISLGRDNGRRFLGENCARALSLPRLIKN